MSKLADLTGKKFGRLTVIKRSYPNDKWNHTFWLCKCDCGKEKVILGSSLRERLTQSCGCLQKEHIREMHRNNEIGIGVANMRAVITNYKIQAKKRGFKWDLTEEQFAKLTKQNCHYCDAKPNNRKKTKDSNGEYIYNGLDRIDNTKSYTIDNVIPCCKICNVAKNNLTLQEFQSWIERVYLKIIRRKS